MDIRWCEFLVFCYLRSSGIPTAVMVEESGIFVNWNEISFVPVVAYVCVDVKIDFEKLEIEVK